MNLTSYFIKQGKKRLESTVIDEMKLNRITAFLMGSITLVLAFFAYMNYIYLLGFPDGFITELGYAQRSLAYIFIGLSVVFSGYFIYLGTVALRKKIARPLSVAVALYSLAIVVVFLVDVYYRSSLIGSGGG
jgi:uncharacterized membrane protein YqjE